MKHTQSVLAALLVIATVACSSEPTGKEGAALDAGAVDTQTLFGDSFGGGNAPGPCDFESDPLAGQPGAPCQSNSDCDTNYCVEGPEGRICTRTCVDCCPQGFACEESKLGDAQFVCMPKLAALCRPCKTDADCGAVNPGALCIYYGVDGAFCGGGCSESGDCPVGYACEQASGSQGAGKQCVRKSGECACSARSIQDGATTYCSVKSGDGFCQGERKCEASGLSPCSAAPGGAEVCNELDDDCDGETDEEIQGPACSASNSFGTCPGFETCDGGKLSCSAPQPQAEACNGKDDNCDGQTDEGFPDTDKDGKADCLDTDQDGDGTPDPLDCAPEDKDVYPGATEVCNGKDDDCDGDTDEPNAQGCKLYYPDADNDGAGNTAKGQCLCIGQPGLSLTAGGDCDDSNKFVFPGAKETCDNVDQDCDGATDEGFDVGKSCTVGTGACEAAGATVCGLDGASTVCGAQTGAPASESCDGVDNDCDGKTDEDFNIGEICETGVGACGGKGTWKCDGSGTKAVCDAPTQGGSKEICDGVDNDCDGQTDETCDDDKDGYCQKGKTVLAGALCSKGGGDCNDSKKDINPGATEICDGIDNDCDGKKDGFEQDCSNSCGKGKKTCTAGAWSGCSAPKPQCTSGACCDGCKFRASTTKCGGSPYKTEEVCSGTCGGQIRVKETWRHCTGSSASCGTSNLKTIDKGAKQTCGGGSLCQTSGGKGSCKACSAGCANGVCNNQPTHVICVDAQFGGSNSGACYAGVCTKTLNLDIAKRLQALLNADTANAEGGGTWKVVMTRTTDTYPAISTRVATCDNANASRILSIAVNAWTSTSTNGATTYYTKASSAGFCQQLQAGVVKTTGLKDRGHKSTTGYGILSKPKADKVCMPAPGYLSNSSDAAKVKDPTFRQKIAEGLLHGVQASFGYNAFTP